MNIQEKITRFTNLEANDSLSAFMGHSAQQSHFAYQVFYDFIKETKPKQILEIGTALGGFTEFLKIVLDELNLDCKILSYDIHARPWYEDMIKKGIDVRVENIFNENFTEVISEVVSFVQKEGTTIVLCDGGWKIGEFKIFSRHIKNSDFILAHDYSFSKEVYLNEIKDKIWNWCEITEEDILETSIENNLIPYNQNKFSGCVWVCKKKQI
jgi:cephalosporin hydroxylase